MGANRTRVGYSALAATWLAAVAALLLTGHVIAGTAVGLAGVSLFFLTRQEPLWRFDVPDLKAVGSSLLTGSLVALAIFGLQYYLSREAEEESEEQQFRLTLAVARDLTGLDPPQSLAGLNLPDKVLDRAELEREDLTGTNLAGSSLREANLAGANLEGANLFGADLRRAVLVGADLDDANLASASLREATIYGPSGVELELRGTKVDSRTCWPADFLNAADERTARLRERLDAQEVVKTGRVVTGASIGYACELNFSDVVQYLQVPDPPQTLAALVAPWDLTPAGFLSALQERLERRDAEGAPLALRERLCQDERAVVARAPGWTGAVAVLVLRAPGEELLAARATVVAADPATESRRDVVPGVLLRRDASLRRPLEAGTEALLLGETDAVHAGTVPDYAIREKASECPGVSSGVRDANSSRGS